MLLDIYQAYNGAAVYWGYLEEHELMARAQEFMGTGWFILNYTFGEEWFHIIDGEFGFRVIPTEGPRNAYTEAN